MNIAAKTVTMAGESHMLVKSIARRFNPDPAAKMDDLSAKLLDDPILQVERMLKGVGADELNSKGGGMCKSYNAVFSKFPFNPASKVDATLDDVNKIFRPSDGLLPTFYKENLQKYLKKDGGEYKPTGEPGPIQMNANFVRFFNETMRFSDMLYPGGVQSPALRYTLTPIKTDVVQSYSVSIDGQKANLTAATGSSLAGPAAVARLRSRLKSARRISLSPAIPGSGLCSTSLPMRTTKPNPVRTTFSNGSRARAVTTKSKRSKAAKSITNSR